MGSSLGRVAVHALVYGHKEVVVDQHVGGGMAKVEHDGRLPLIW